MTKNITLYQMKEETEGIFMGLPEEKDSVSLANYDEVWTGTVYDLEYCNPRIVGAQGSYLLEQLFITFNFDNRPGAKEFRSMSVSDVVKLTNQHGKESFFFCSSFGFTPVTTE